MSVASSECTQSCPLRAVVSAWRSAASTRAFVWARVRAKPRARVETQQAARACVAPLRERNQRCRVTRRRPSRPSAARRRPLEAARAASASAACAKVRHRPPPTAPHRPLRPPHRRLVCFVRLANDSPLPRVPPPLAASPRLAARCRFVALTIIFCVCWRAARSVIARAQAAGGAIFADQVEHSAVVAGAPGRHRRRGAALSAPATHWAAARVVAVGGLGPAPSAPLTRSTSRPHGGTLCRICCRAAQH